MRSVSALLTLKLFCFLLSINTSLPYSLKACTTQYQEKSSDDVYLDCASRRLLTVPDDLPKDSVSVKLTYNQLKAINKDEFYHMLKLRILFLDHNDIVHVDDGAFIHLVSLKTLDMKFNNLANLTCNMFQGLSNLTKLDLSENDIESIPRSAFQFLTSIQFLYLISNKLYQITEIQPVLLLPNIQMLNLISNSFSSFDTKDLHGNYSSCLKELSLSGLKQFSITTPIFPHLQTVQLSRSVMADVLKWDVTDKTLLGNLTKVWLPAQKFSFENVQKLLESFSSLRYLGLNDVDSFVKRGVLSTVCKIPTLRTLALFDPHLNLTFELVPCSQLTELDLSWSPIPELPKGSMQSLKELRVLNLSHNLLTEVPHDIRRLAFLQILQLQNNQISSLGCSDFMNTTRLTELSLNNNKIKTVNRCVFENLSHLKRLNLSGNQLPRFGDMFMIFLQQLEVLDMSNNSIKTFTPDGLDGLKSLKQLNVGISIGKANNERFHGIKTLESLNESWAPQSEFNLIGFQNLESLTIYIKTSGFFKMCQHANYEKTFSLKSLKRFTLIWNINPELTSFDYLKDMDHLEIFTAEKMFTGTPDVDIFLFNPQLKSVVLTNTGITNLESKLFHRIPNLEFLDLSESKLKSLDFLVQANLTALRYLKVTDNEINVVNETVFNYLPSLIYLDLSNNPLTCECYNADFIYWIKSNKQTQVVNAHRYICSFPVDKRGTLFLDFDIRPCWNDGSFYYFLCSTCLVLLTLLTSFIYHFLRWQLAYTFHLFLAFLYDSRRTKTADPHQFDAFVSYNVHDEDWVYREMLPVLEGEQGWRLCLHHRDFQPGKPIMENITEAIYGSRKTICVISRHYLQSEWCSREIQMASFRLFDEQKDVLILLFLEEIPSRHLSPYYRMRKLVKKRTYLSWPQAAQHPGVFWQNVQRALQTGDALTENTDLLTGPPGPPGPPGPLGPPGP